jgi:hypothetical protein
MMQALHRGAEAWKSSERRALMPAFRFLCVSVPLCEFLCQVTAALFALAPCIASAQHLDPAAWGGDHVGKPVANFTSGDECLFCHRDIGSTWFRNRHGQTIEEYPDGHISTHELARLPQLKPFADETRHLLGGNNRLRFLKPSAEHGRLDLLSVEFVPPRSDAPGKLLNPDDPRWNTKTFAAQCAGCHCTGVDSAKQAFAAISLDCFVCHGEPPEKHTTQASLVFLSPHRRDSAAVVTSICAQCHLRTGKSRSSGLPYPNNFVAGDNLFRDFEVDLSAAAIEKLNSRDRHVQQNVRDVVLLGKEDITCLTCHDIHKQSSQKHRRVADNENCNICHSRDSKRLRVPYQIHSTTCGY